MQIKSSLSRSLSDALWREVVMHEMSVNKAKENETLNTAHDGQHVVDVEFKTTRTLSPLQ